MWGLVLRLEIFLVYDDASHTLTVKYVGLLLTWSEMQLEFYRLQRATPIHNIVQHLLHIHAWCQHNSLGTIFTCQYY